MTFTEAVAAMVAGERVSRPRQFREDEAHYLNPDASPDHPAFLINENGLISPWTPTLTDMQADDWVIYTPPAVDTTPVNISPPRRSLSTSSQGPWT
jgi:hypothetical protein